ncbi:MAG: carbohydrate porin [Planctomycetes bacterium]|nr:carbohydrate porin [Planctomycetota bacterium]
MGAIMASFLRKTSVFWGCVLIFAFGDICNADYYSDHFMDYNTNDSRYHLKNYSGDLKTMPNLLGDWRSRRNQMAEQGIIFEAGITGVVQTNTHGGTNTSKTASSGGSADYWLMFDTERLGFWPGGLWTFHAETLFGQNVFRHVRSVMPVSHDALLPRPDPGLTTLSELYLTQYFGFDLSVTVGKVDPSNLADKNAFANDERRQFMSTALTSNPILFPLAQYTALAVAAEYKPLTWVSMSFFALDNNATVTRSGFDTAFQSPQGTTLGTELAFKVEPCGYKGTQRFGYAYSNRDFNRLDPDFRVNLPAGAGSGKKRDDYVLWYNFDQYIFTEKDDPTQGIGLFGRYGYSNGKANVLDEFYSFGIGGKGIVEGRDDDTFGLGYYYAGVSNDFPKANNLSHEEGIEIYYAAQMTKSVQVTQTLQWIGDPGAGGIKTNGDAVVLGLRLQIDF